MPWLKGKIASSVVKYRRISQRLSFKRHCLKHLHMSLHYSKCVAFTAFAFLHRVRMWVQIWFFILCVYRRLVVTFVSIQVKSLVYGSYVCERDSCLISLIYEIHTIAFFGPLARPNNQMYSVVTTIKNVFTSHTACTGTQQNLQI